MRWKTILFDLDGTLADPMLGITRSVQYALRHFGIETDDLRTLCPFIGPPLRDSFMEFYGMSETEAETAVAKTREYFVPKGIFENEPYDGIAELLRDLRKAGATLVMATSKPEPFARQIAGHFGFADRFALICGATLDGSRTTKADIVRYALARLTTDEAVTSETAGQQTAAPAKPAAGVSVPEATVPPVCAARMPVRTDTVMVGDRRFDIEGAAAAGIDSIGVLYGYGSREELEAARPTRIAADVPELRRLLL